jgi:rhamnosyltransferase
MVNQLQEIVGSGDVSEKCARSQAVAAIVVTYNPDPDGLRRGLREIAKQADFVVVVDNASHNLNQCQLDQMGRELNTRLEVVRQPQNIGLGAGFNAGIEVAEKLGYPFIVLFDQDSVPQAGMIGELKRSYETLVERGIRVAAVGPRFRDAVNGSLSDFITRDDGHHVSPCEEVAGTVVTDFLISSGTFMPMSVFREVGLMDETLFIDYVDTEWCLRGQSKGWVVHGVCAAIMEHSLGESRRRMWFIRWRNVPYHKPFRYYYIFRNSLLLRHRAYVPVHWKKANLLHNITLAGYLLCFIPGRFANLRMIWQGIRDGRKGVAGRM